MASDFESGVIAGFIVTMGIMLIALGVCSAISDNRWEKTAINAKAAHYDPVTSEFTWNYQPEAGESNESKN